MPLLRRVQLKDAAELTRIYNYYVENTIITFELLSIGERDWVDRMERITGNSKYPFLVLEDDGSDDITTHLTVNTSHEDDTRDKPGKRLLGYAYGNKFRERAAYDATAELSVYLDNDIIESRKGYGTLLYTAVLDHLRANGVREAIGGISCPNPASFAFHEKLGFKKVGIFEKVGFKFDAWIDVAFYQLHL